jgi:uncharacterized protein DUF4037
VEPLLREHFGAVPHGAARLGPGSEVVGFDTARSTDHDWGPRVQLFVEADAAAIGAMLAERLPKTFLGYSTHFAGDGPVLVMAETDGPVRHRVDVLPFGEWAVGHLGFDPRGPVGLADWLGTPTQALAEVTAGAVFHDGLGEVEAARARLRWYPDEVWRYVLACQWRRISQEEAFVGRCGEVGDELGSAVVAARLVRDLMRLCLLLERRYPLYGKWSGSQFSALPDAPDLLPVLAATDWRDREHHLARAYETVAVKQNALGLTDPVDPTTRPYHDRPFQVLHAERFADALRATITDPGVAALSWRGAVDQHVDNTDALMG